MRKLFHHFQGTVKLFLCNVAYADALANFCYQWDTLFSVAVFNSIFAALPRKVRCEVLGICGQGQRLHAAKNLVHCIHSYVATQVTEYTAEEPVNIYSFTMHDI